LLALDPFDVAQDRCRIQGERFWIDDVYLFSACRPPIPVYNPTTKVPLVEGDMDNGTGLILNEEERALLDSDPEGCLRHAVQRGALSLDEITASLSPHGGSVVRSIVTGERLTAPGPPLARALAPQETAPGKLASLGVALRSIVTGERASESPEEETPSPLESASAQRPGLEEQLAASWEANYQSLAAWPGLQGAVDEGVLAPVEALGVANYIDGILGRYMTGTRYAAP
jgi:hypothetical protein